jgi:glutamate racemase
VEEGWLNHPVTIMILREYLRPLLANRIDTLVLGCTHYPLLKKAIRKVAGSKVALVDSAESCARDVRKGLEELKLLRTKRPQPGTIQPFVTDETDPFAKLAGRFLGAPTEPPWKVDLAPL